MRSDVVKMYRDVHGWVGIVCGLALFIAFYAGAINIFQTPLKRWASPPVTLVAPPLSETQALIDATLKAVPQARKAYTIDVEMGPEAPARMRWTDAPDGRSGPDSDVFISAYDSKGELVVTKSETSTVAEFINILHQKVGLPFPYDFALPISGIVALLYGLALISGLIVLLTSIAKDWFAVRIGDNKKRMWLDIHNIIGVFSLPYHIIIALTAVGLALGAQISDAQNITAWDGKLKEVSKRAQTKYAVALRPGEAFLPPERLVERIHEQADGFKVQAIRYATKPGGKVEVRVRVRINGYAQRGANSGFTAVNPYSGDIIFNDQMPGRQDAFDSTVTSFYALHFGNFGGTPIRWAYMLLGLSGAFLFYTGNLLWVESRRKVARRTNPDVTQPLKLKVMGALTIGVAFGTMAGISTTIAAAKLLPGIIQDMQAAHHWVFYLALFASMIWAFLRGAARGALELHVTTIIAMLLIPGASLASAILPDFGWNHGGTTLMIDLIAIAGAAVLVMTLMQTRNRVRSAPIDSIWHVSASAKVQDVTVLA